MHETLKPRTSLLLLIVWLTALSVALTFAPIKPFTVVCIAVVVGGIAGVLQLRAISATAQHLVKANTAMLVRQALRSNVSGRYSIYLLWAFAVGLIVLVFSEQPENPFFTLVAGYSAFALVREAVALPALLKLSAR